AYVDNNLVGSGKVSKAAIIGQSGGVWATSPGYNLSPAEQKAIVNAFTNPAETQANGVRLAGQKFFVLSVDVLTGQILGKKGASSCFIRRADGCTIIKTKQAILVTEYKAPIQHPESVPIVVSVADYLKSVNY
ncbi:profilin, partial [Pisolithus orientalis]|uniref:profilin n=1 Tax=Pisolithus orientalis TaxID=936130 RepID=UPI0022249D66